MARIYNKLRDDAVQEAMQSAASKALSVLQKSFIRHASGRYLLLQAEKRQQVVRSQPRRPARRKSA
jgi:hypothetical protein